MKFKIALTLALLFSMSFVSNAQNKVITKAKLSFVSGKYSEASEKCAEAYSKITRKGKNAKKQKGELAYMTAESFRFTGRFREANEWYDRALLLDYEEIVPEVYLHNAEMYRMMSEFEKAIENYNEYLKLVPEDEMAIAGVESCKRNKEYEAEKTRHVVENEAILNTKEFDMAPMFGDRKSTKMYFGSSRDGGVGSSKDPISGESFMALWVSILDKKGNWTEPFLVKGEAINTIDNEGTVCFDKRFKTMFFTRCPTLKKQNLGCDIWMSEAKGKEEWKEPVKVEIKAHDSVSVGHPCTIDGKYLIFASDMAGGYGGKDLWAVTYDKKAKAWSTPVNLGPEINTKGNELFPTFALNGDLIYATDGLPGLGGLDIFIASKVGEENKWENPENFGSPINSTGNDFHLIEKDEKSGYFTSERKSVNGEYVPDIFSYVLPPNLFDLKVNVTELGNKAIKIEDVRVIVKGSDNTTWEGYTDDNGSIYWDKRPEDATIRFINEETSYTINISKEGYHEDKNGSSFTTVGLPYAQNFVIDMELLPKKPIRLPEVRYPLNKWDLLVDSTINSPDSLLFVLELLKEYPGMTLELNSHTDSRGSNKANQKLSENRAKSCYNYLVDSLGVDARRIVPIGKGEELARTVWKKGEIYLAVRPADMDGVEEIVLTEKYINSFKSTSPDTYKMLHQLNRRTDARVISMDFNPATAPAADPKLKIYVKYP